MRFNNKVFSIVLVILISVLATACSSSTVTTEIFSFTPEEEKELITKASDYLTTQNANVVKETAKITSFKSGSELIIYDDNGKKTKDIKDIQTIIIDFEVKNPKNNTVKVYLDENKEILGYF